MDHKQRTWSREKSTQVPVLYIVCELANNMGKMACSDGSKFRHTTVTAGDVGQVHGAIIRAGSVSACGAHGKSHILPESTIIIGPLDIQGMLWIIK